MWLVGSDVVWAGLGWLRRNFLSRYACMHEVQEIRSIPFNCHHQTPSFFEVEKKSKQKKKGKEKVEVVNRRANNPLAGRTTDAGGNRRKSVRVGKVEFTMSFPEQMMVISDMTG